MAILLQYCQGEGGRLVEILDQEKQTVVDTFAESNRKTLPQTGQAFWDRYWMGKILFLNFSFIHPQSPFPPTFFEYLAKDIPANCFAKYLLWH